MNSKESFLKKQETLAAITPEKIELWNTIIDEAQVDTQTKQKIKERLLNLQKNALTTWNSLGLAIAGTIDAIITIKQKDPNQAEAQALFENIKDDLWSLIKSENNK